MLRDTRAAESWQGRMTRAVLEHWKEKGGERSRKEGKWYWEFGEGTSEEELEAMEIGQGVVIVEDVFGEVRGLR
jgi:hypothetical protein